MNLSSFDENYLIRRQISYVRGSSTQNLNTQSLNSTLKNLMMALL
ncbi:hypothetical protein [Campylobacter sp. MIT 97-5078]|nr:hypothetical protein [Campylobacter sp. MIT 97-5078]